MVVSLMFYFCSVVKACIEIYRDFSIIKEKDIKGIIYQKLIVPEINCTRN